MAAATTSSGGSGLGWLVGIVFVVLVIVVILPMAAMPAMVTETNNAAEQAKPPAAMTDEELDAALNAARAAAEAATGTAKHDALKGVGKLLDELAARRGWDLFTNAELAEMATAKMLVIDIPGEGATEVNIAHVAKHGADAVEIVQTGGWRPGNCNGGRKQYDFKLADDGRYWLRIKWDGDVITCFRATWSYILWSFKQDGCALPRPPFGHDGMSSPAY